jgi:hypothetical protein
VASWEEGKATPHVSKVAARRGPLARYISRRGDCFPYEFSFKALVRQNFAKSIMSDSEFIAARQERYRVAHNTLDPEKLLACMTDEVDYSDHGKHFLFKCRSL